MHVALSIAMLVILAAGLSFEVVTFCRGDDLVTDGQVHMAIKRERISGACYIIAAALGFAAQFWFISVFIVLFGVIMRDNTRSVRKKAKVIKALLDQERDRAARDHQDAIAAADRVAADLDLPGHSPAITDPDVLASIEAALRESQQPVKDR